MAIAAQATRSFAQSAVAVLIAIYLGLHGFSLKQVGAFLTVGAVGAALAAVVAGVLGDADGRRRTLQRQLLALSRPLVWDVDADRGVPAVWNKTGSRALGVRRAVSRCSGEGHGIGHQRSDR
jgi:hypothetical protein